MRISWRCVGRTQDPYNAHWMQMSAQLCVCGKWVHICALFGDECGTMNWCADTVKKAFRYSRPQPGCQLPNSPWAGIMPTYIIYSLQGEFGKWHPGWGREYRKSFLTVNAHGLEMSAHMHKGWKWMGICTLIGNECAYAHGLEMSAHMRTGWKWVRLFTRVMSMTKGINTNLREFS